MQLEKAAIINSNSTKTLSTILTADRIKLHVHYTEYSSTQSISVILSHPDGFRYIPIQVPCQWGRKYADETSSPFILISHSTKNFYLRMEIRKKYIASKIDAVEKEPQKNPSTSEHKNDIAAVLGVSWVCMTYILRHFYLVFKFHKNLPWLGSYHVCLAQLRARGNPKSKSQEFYFQKNCTSITLFIHIHLLFAEQVIPHMV